MFKNEFPIELERFLKLPRISVLWFEKVFFFFLTGMMSSNLAVPL